MTHTHNTYSMCALDIIITGTNSYFINLLYTILAKKNERKNEWSL